MKALFVYIKNMDRTLDGYRKGEAPSNFLYGFTYMKEFGIEADIYRSFENKFFEKLKGIFGKIGTIGEGIIYLVKVPFCLAKYDILVVIHYGTLLPLIVLKLLFFRKKKIIFINDRAEKFVGNNPWKRFLINKCDKIICLSENQYKDTKKFFTCSTTYSYFGSDTEFYKKTIPGNEEDYVFSVGADQGRDFKTLIAAARALPDIKFVIATKEKFLKGINLPNNVEFLGFVSPLKLRELYQKAKFVVISLYSDRLKGENTVPISPTAGGIVLSDCISLGKPVIISNMKYVTEYVKPNRDAIVVPCEDMAEMKKAIKELWNNKERRIALAENISKLRDKFNIRNFAKVLANHIKNI